MDFFNLPNQSKVTRVIPKNAFDEYTSTKQKRLLTDLVLRITWTHKLSRETINLEAKEILEIQVFKVELKQKADISKILDIIDKAIPYHIVFWIEFNQQAYVSSALKHSHPNSDDISVIDWRFNCHWFNIDTNTYVFNLNKSIDAVFKNMCVQLTGKQLFDQKPFSLILKNEKEINRLENEIDRLKKSLRQAKQFNKKVELNIELQSKLELLKQVESRAL